MSSLYTLLSLVGYPGRECVHYTDQHRFFVSSSIRAPYAEIPALLVLPTKREYTRLLIVLPGGPGGSFLYAADAPSNDLMFNLVDRGYALLFLGYAGTRLRSSYPKEDLPPASAQLLSYTRRLYKPSTQTVAILAVSAAAPLAVSMAAQVDLPIVLLSPPLRNPKYLVAYAKRSHDGRAYYKSKTTLYNMQTDPNLPRQTKGITVTQEERSRRFFLEMLIIRTSLTCSVKYRWENDEIYRLSLAVTMIELGSTNFRS